jgi:protein-L-isoaspartate(D-aspartate) O-methyltransferase
MKLGLRSCLVLAFAALLACKSRPQQQAPGEATLSSSPGLGARANEPSLDPPEARAERAKMVRELSGGVRSQRVLAAMDRVPRHLFVPGVALESAYADVPLPIGYDQTISQPSVVAIMTDALDVRPNDRVLEIGTGSGYQAAILSLLAREVYTIELLSTLGDIARKRLADLGYSNVEVRVGNGYQGWPERAPFDRILVTAAPEQVPPHLSEQLAEGGVLVAPVGLPGFAQKLLRYRKAGGEISVEDLGMVRFVPMVR